MEQRTFDELISDFNSTVSKWEIDLKYKFKLLGMIASIGYEHEKMLNNLPSAEPKNGKWIKIKNHHYGTHHDFDYYTIRCSVCGDRPEKAWHLTPFCPNCGAKMEGEWMSDLISRQDALRALSKEVCGDKIWALDARDAIVHLPSAEPEPKTGKWIRESLVTDYPYKCSVCKKYSRAMYDFCPNCGSYNVGAKMEGEE